MSTKDGRLSESHTRGGGGMGYGGGGEAGGKGKKKLNNAMAGLVKDAIQIAIIITIWNGIFQAPLIFFPRGTTVQAARQ